MAVIHSNYRDFSDTYTGIATGTTVRSYKGFKSVSIQVKGTGASATSWTVVLEGSIDGSNFTTLLTHTDTTGNGNILFSGANLYTCLYLRSRVTALVLGPATNIRVDAMGIA